METCNYRGKVLEFHTDFDKWYVQWNDPLKPIIHRLAVAGFYPIVGAATIEVVCVYMTLTLDEEIISSSRYTYAEKQYLNFYNAIVPFSVGQFCAISTINGMTRRSTLFEGSQKNGEGILFFDALGQLRQPVTLDVELSLCSIGEVEGEFVVNADGGVTVNVIDGIPPFTYVLSPGGEPQPDQPDQIINTEQSQAIFSNLEQGTYTLTVTASNTANRSKQISITKQEEVAI